MSIPSSTRRQDSNPWPLDQELSPITTRPRLPPLHVGMTKIKEKDGGNLNVLRRLIDFELEAGKSFWCLNSDSQVLFPHLGNDTTYTNYLFEEGKIWKILSPKLSPKCFHILIIFSNVLC